MARKTKRTTYGSVEGARLLQANGGLVFCGNCEKIVGNINSLNYNFLMLVFSCTCDNYGCVEISRNKTRYNTGMKANKMPLMRKDVCCCSNCKEPLFGMIVDRIDNYSFYVECKCGEKFDVKPNFAKRLGVKH